MKEFFAGYLECALWCGVIGPDGDTVSDAEESRLTKEARAELLKDARSFYDEHCNLIAERPRQAGHDFWLTRNGHGAGFWDGGWPKHGDVLTKAAKVYGSVDLYLHEGWIHVS